MNDNGTKTTEAVLDSTWDELSDLLCDVEHGRTRDTATAASTAIDVYKLAKQGEAKALEPWQRLQTRAKSALSDIIAETGVAEWAGQFGRCYVPAAGVSVSYDAKALDALCASDPDLAAKLQPHRKVSERPGSLTVR